MLVDALKAATVFKTIFVQAGRGYIVPDVRAAGLDVQLWASCAQITLADLQAEIARVQPSRFVAQIENDDERDLFYRYAPSLGLPLDVVTTGNGLYGEADRLREFGVQRTWCEAYLQDGREPNDMVNQLRKWWGLPCPLPVIGCYRDVGPAAYDLAAFGKRYAVWRWEQLPPDSWQQFP